MTFPTTKRLRVRLDVVVEFPEEMSRLPGEDATEQARTIALYEGLTAAIGATYGAHVKRVAGYHEIGLDFRPAKKARAA